MDRIVLDVKLAGRDEPVRVVLESLPAVIGRREGCEIRIEDKQVSRRHAAIDRRGERIWIRDLDSRNGTRVNGVRVRERALAQGDEIRAGDAVLRVCELAAPAGDSGGAGGEGAAALPATRRRRLASRAIPPILLLILGAGAALYLEWDSDRAARRADPDSGRVQEASSALADLRRDAAAAPLVTDAVIERAKALRERYREAVSTGSDPFGDFIEAIESRRRSEILSALFAAETQVRALLEEERYKEALDVARAAPAGTLAADVERTIAGACDQLIADATYFRDLEREGEGIARCEGRLPKLAGTAYERKLRDAIDSLRASLADRERRRREAEEAIARAERETGPAGKEAAAPSPPGLWSILSPRIAAGALREKTYRFPGDLDGSPVAIADGFRIVVEGPAGKREVAFSDIPPALQIEMAADALEGEALLDAARFGFASGQGEAAGLLLLRYVSTAEEGRRPERQEKVNSLLAAVRGLDRVPEGGYSFSAGHGWEDAGQRADRKAVEGAATIARAFPSTSTKAALERTFARIERILDDRSLSGSARGEVRRLAIDGLSRLRERAAKSLAAEADRSALPVLRKVRAELAQRRAAALAVIFDTSVYLPESHPDWPKGDRVNGQEAVDKAVAAVRELWDNPSLAVALSGRLHELAAIVHAVDERLRDKLRHRIEAEDASLMDEVLNNPGNRIGLREYAPARGDADLRAHNREVDAFNRSLPDPDLSEDEKAHVEVVNDYREMLGLRRLSIDIRLCRATGKHSEACNAAGRIWHDGPDGTPQSRAQAEGYPGGVAENVAIGYANGRDIWWRGWYRASDHHRNALAAGHACIGYGYAGSVGTQNFGSVAPERPAGASGSAGRAAS